MFVNPFTMFLGAALVSSPIVIHLINRIRYKRVRWAAMEFLLKSQKRSKRKLIIEQLILLLLRILIVLLIAILLARFLGFTSAQASEEKYTKHVIILDDTPSIGDVSKGSDNKANEALEQAKIAIAKIAKEANGASTAQYLHVIRLSELEDPKGNIGRLNDTTVRGVSTYLKTIKPAGTHVDLMKGLDKAEAIFNDEKEGKKNLYLVSDFRSTDWTSTQESQLQKKFAGLKESQIQVILFDVAGPERSKTETQKPPLYSDNLAITDFRPSTRIAVDGVPTDFSLSVANYSTSEKQVFVKIRVNGKEKLDASQNIARIPPNQTVTVRFPITLTLPDRKDVPKETLDSKLWQLKRFNVVTAELQKKEDAEPGLSVDDQRYTVVDVRNRIPILLVDNAAAEHGKKGSESFYIYKMFSDTLKGFEVKFAVASQLDKMNLQSFSSVMLCNVPKLEDAARRNLEDYVANGGGVAFFMGPAISENDVKFYNENLYRAGKGLFPVPLEPKVKNAGLTEKEVSDLAGSMRVTLTEQLLIKKQNRSHPALAKLFDETRLVRDVVDDAFARLTRFIAFPQYFIVNRRGLINDGQEKVVDTLMNLPYYGGSLKGASAESQESDRVLFNETIALLKKLPIADENFAKYADQLKALKKETEDAIRDTRTKMPEVAAILKDLIEPRNDGSDKPNLRTMWQDPEMTELYRDLRVLWDRMQYGDAIYLAKTFGNGRVLAWLGSAGASWNPSDTGYFPPFLRDSVQSYLGSSGTDLNLTLKMPYEFTLDPAQYAATANKWFVHEKAAGAGESRPAGDVETLPESRESQVLETVNEPGENKPKSLNLLFTEGTEPGVYLFEFTEQRPNPNGQIDKISDFRALAYNFDTTTESNLSRAVTGDLMHTAGVTEVYTASSPGLSTILNNRQSDYSEKPWLYLLMLLVLIAEQAMAVRLSFHARPTEETHSVPVLTGRGVVTT